MIADQGLRPILDAAGVKAKYPKMYDKMIKHAQAIPQGHGGLMTIDPKTSIAYTVDFGMGDHWGGPPLTPIQLYTGAFGFGAVHKAELGKINWKNGLSPDEVRKLLNAPAGKGYSNNATHFAIVPNCDYDAIKAFTKRNAKIPYTAIPNFYEKFGKGAAVAAAASAGPLGLMAAPAIIALGVVMPSADDYVGFINQAYTVLTKQKKALINYNSGDNCGTWAYRCLMTGVGKAGQAQITRNMLSSPANCLDDVAALKGASQKYTV